MAQPKIWLDDDDNYSFTLMNEEMLDRLMREGTVKLPKKKINIPKDMRWNLKTFNSELIQGLMAGDSMAEIAKRIFPEIWGKTGNATDAGIVKKCLQSAVRNARTMVTGAENEGRLDSYKKLDEEGVVQKKQWVATADDRTRPSHLDMDGEEQDIDAVFSNGCRYPGDGQGPAEEVWQCRCTMTDRIVGFRRADGSISYVKGEQGRGIHHDAIDEERSSRSRGQGQAMPQKPSLKDIGMKPQRPSRDEWAEKGEAYKEERQKWTDRVNEWIKASVPEKNMSIGEFSEWCNQHDIKIYGDIDGVDGRALTAYSERMDKLSKDFPEVMKYREKMGLEAEFSKYEFAFEKNRLDFLAEASHGFTFGSSGSDIEDLLRSQANDVLQGYRTMGDGTLNQLFDHEFGHNVYDSLKYAEGRENSFERRLALEKDLIQNVYNKAGMSEYAATNDDELFAEAFAAWYGGEKTEFAEAFGEFLRRWI